MKNIKDDAMRKKTFTVKCLVSTSIKNIQYQVYVHLCVRFQLTYFVENVHANQDVEAAASMQVQHCII